jgi:hypothetical protein
VERQQASPSRSKETPLVEMSTESTVYQHTGRPARRNKLDDQYLHQGSVSGLSYSMSESQIPVTPTLLDRLVQLTRFDRLTKKLPLASPYPPLLFVFCFIIFDAVVVNTYTHLTGGTHSVVRNPFYISLYLGIILAVIGVRYMHEGHVDAVTTLTDREICDVEHTAQYALSIRTKLLFYVLGLLAFFGYQVFIIGVQTVIQNQGLAGIAFTLVLLPGCYLPVAIDFLSEYATLHLFLPRWLREQNLGLFFFDPQNMGGFQPIGTLLKNSYYFYTAGLLLYLTFYYGQSVVPIQALSAEPPGVSEAAMFTALWLFGLLTLSYSMYQTHRIMKSERQERLRDIEAEIHEIIDNPHDISNAEITDQERLDSLEYRLEQVRTTSEYPTTFTMWTQIGVSVLLPQILQLTLQAAV